MASKIYVSCHDSGVALREIASLVRHGHTIVSTWHYGDNQRPQTPEAWRRIAMRAESEIAICDVLVFMCDPGTYPGSKFVEVGIAIGLEKRVIVVGQRGAGFLFHPRVIETTELLQCLAEM